MITRSGVIKKTDMSAFANIRKAGLTAVNLREDDELIAAFLAERQAKIFSLPQETEWELNLMKAMSVLWEELQQE